MAAGCDQIIIITGRGKNAIEDHFDVSYELEKTLEEKDRATASLCRVEHEIRASLVEALKERDSIRESIECIEKRIIYNRERVDILMFKVLVTAHPPTRRRRFLDNGGSRIDTGIVS